MMKNEGKWISEGTVTSGFQKLDQGAAPMVATEESLHKSGLGVAVLLEETARSLSRSRWVSSYICIASVLCYLRLYLYLGGLKAWVAIEGR